MNDLYYNDYETEQTPIVNRKLSNRTSDDDDPSLAFIFDDRALQRALKHIYEQDFHPMTEIEENLFNETFRIFSAATDEGLAQSSVELPVEFRQKLDQGNAIFSAFKVHRMQNDIASQLHDSNGILKPFKQWKNDVHPMLDHHVEHWLRTEYNTAVIRSRQAADWQRFEQYADILPNLEWMPSTSATPGADHRAFWGTILPINHPFWSSHRPGDRWNCKCSLSATDAPPTGAPPESTDPKNQPAPGLDNNPGRDGKLFGDTHPYIANAYKGAREAVKKFIEEHSTVGSNVPAGLNSQEQRMWIDNVHSTEDKLKLEQGKPMTFDEANGKKGNPNYAQHDGYKENCQSCVVANELRRRGYDVEARMRIKSDSENIPQQLSSKTEWAWIDPKTGERPKKLTAGGEYWDANLRRYRKKSAADLKKDFDELTKDTGRYHLSFNWRGRNIEGHIITAERFDNGGLRLYDPQTGDIVEWKLLKTKIKTENGIRLYRVDNLLINENIIEGIVKKASQ